MPAVSRASSARADGAGHAGNMTKEVKLDNGMMVHVPMFMNQGDKIVVNTDSGEYSERSND